MKRQVSNKSFARTSFLYGGNATYIEELYNSYKNNPNSVDIQWQIFFSEKIDHTAVDYLNKVSSSCEKSDSTSSISDIKLVDEFDPDWRVTQDSIEKKINLIKPGTGKLDKKTDISQEYIQRAARDSIRALMLIRAYRIRGHLRANLDPLSLSSCREDHNELNPTNYGFTEADYDRLVYLDGILGLEFATVKEILSILERVYCSNVGIEFMHISNPYEKKWLQQRIESTETGNLCTRSEKKAILAKLIEAEGFEKFLDVKYKGTKRFGLDGAESLIPALEYIIKCSGKLGVKEIVLGMSHRGRLNVLANVMGKPHRAIFKEFKGGHSSPNDVEGSGDVKYHLGASSDYQFDGNNIHLSLTANPSHLEIVDPVVLGKVRAKQDAQEEKTASGSRVRDTILPLLLHGDAAFAGQGVVAECFGLSGLKGHRTGGSVHFIVNNQVGFTTNPRLSRSSPYPSDVAKMIEAPIFHVNGDDPEAVISVAKMAIEFRQKFHKPVIIDMFCYRRFGHNEIDEPAFTQPLMYKKIARHPTTAQIYGEKLVNENLVNKKEIDDISASWRNYLNNEFESASGYFSNKADWLDGAWSGLKVAGNLNDARRGKTGVKTSLLQEIGKKLCFIPKNFKIHSTIQRFMKKREEIITSGQNVDWATAESLAFGSLLIEGHGVRLSGQDSERGTFSQRHSVLYDQSDEKRYIPLNSLSETQAEFDVVNSMLSEEAVLGYEYGYSLAAPDALVLWEGQFGDFVNGAQVIIDQFISSGERKWLRMTGLVLLLPHGYEGQGPEHSSARLERFLQLCAEDNMQVANCTTPANYFHILRRQLCRDFRKPLVLMTPKSLLRHKFVVSELSDMGEGTFFHRLLLDDAQFKRYGSVELVADNKIRRVILCSGKVYFDLYQERERLNINDIYLLRIEQIYPFPEEALAIELFRFKNAEWFWCQEEPKNMGAWFFVKPYLEKVFTAIQSKNKEVVYVGRSMAASPATGQLSKHNLQLQLFLEEAFS